MNHRMRRMSWATRLVALAVLLATASPVLAISGVEIEYVGVAGRPNQRVFCKGQSDGHGADRVKFQARAEGVDSDFEGTIQWTVLQGASRVTLGSNQGESIMVFVKTDTAGEFTIKLKATNSEASSDHKMGKAGITIFKVDTLTASKGSNTAVDSGKEKESPLRTIYVFRKDNDPVNITVDPKPNVSTSELPDSWKISKVSGNLKLTVSDKLNATVDRSEIGEAVVQVKCHDGDKDHFQVRVVVATILVTEMTFSGNKFHQLIEDNATNLYAPPHWLDQDEDGGASGRNGDRRFPVAYERNNRIQVSAVFTPDNENVLDGVDPAKIKIQGTGPDGLSINPADVTAVIREHRGKKRILFAAPVSTRQKLQNTVKYYNRFEITWAIALDGNQFVAAGMTDNRLYGLLAKPKNDLFLLETVVDVATRKADGVQTPQALVVAMWKEYSSRAVRRKDVDGHNAPDNKLMTYWADTNNQQLIQKIAANCQSFKAMIDPSPTDPALNGIGTCQAWSVFMALGFDAHGVRGRQLIEVRPDPMKVANVGFILVNKYVFTKHVHSGANRRVDTQAAATDQALANVGQFTQSPNFPAILAGANRTIESVPKLDDGIGNGVVAAFAGPAAPQLAPYTHIRGFDLFALPGVVAQSVKDPPSSFGNHFVLRFAGRIYDPSYGTDFKNINIWESRSLAGFAMNQRPFQGLDRPSVANGGAKETLVRNTRF